MLTCLILCRRDQIRPPEGSDEAFRSSWLTHHAGISASWRHRRITPALALAVGGCVLYDVIYNHALFRAHAHGRELAPARDERAIAPAVSPRLSILRRYHLD